MNFFFGLENENRSKMKSFWIQNGAENGSFWSHFGTILEVQKEVQIGPKRPISAMVATILRSKWTPKWTHF